MDTSQNMSPLEFQADTIVKNFPNSHGNSITAGIEVTEAAGGDVDPKARKPTYHATDADYVLPNE